MQLLKRNDHWIKTLARTGLVAKGVVYCLTAILTIMSALQMGNASSGDADKGGIFKMVHEQPLGKILLSIITVGLICYAVWRLVMAFKDTEDKGKDWKGLGQRAVYFFSGAVYLSISVIAGKLILNNTQSSGNSRQQLARELLDKPMGVWLAAAVAISMMGVGIYQVYRAASGKYKKYVKAGMHSNNNERTILIRSGQLGYTARGIVWLIVGWLFLKAATSANANEAGNTGKAFQWLQSSYGNILLFLVAAGLFCYGVFMFMRAKYQPIHTS
ncbi:DUF1206 domain-containing protein [Aridibaculum aurantiacum]|uniref:DUF1206 domain-containing protein n=1 Tax=Aridibaculum aurantiacum TaxID=2810307 RepID=UPI001A95BF6F|nr:DUF1206 domain-containing protein [Aridibaculum aurantiacum]